MEELPTVYWMPKLHKSLYGSRFIAVSNKCTNKPLSSLLTCLMALLAHFEEYCAGICRNTGINCFGVINNTQLVLHSLYKLNCTLDGKSLDTTHLRGNLSSAYLECLRYSNTSPRGNHNYKQQPSLVTLDI